MLIVLSGASSSGKTALAVAMQASADRPLVHLEADRFVPAIPPSMQDDQTYRERFVIAIHEAVAALGRNGLDVIVDGSLPNDAALRDRCLAILREVPGTLIVAVRCSDEDLQARETARGDRSPGWAVSQAVWVHEGVDYDRTVDTSDKTPEEAAQELLGTIF